MHFDGQNSYIGYPNAMGETKNLLMLGSIETNSSKVDEVKPVPFNGKETIKIQGVTTNHNQVYEHNMLADVEVSGYFENNSGGTYPVNNGKNIIGMGSPYYSNGWGRFGSDVDAITSTKFNLATGGQGIWSTIIMGALKHFTTADAVIEVVRKD